jgi:hypothetical protein
MVLSNLVSLVLRNVNAVNGGLTGEMLRHGPGYQTDSQTPEIPISKRHPSQGAKQVAMQLAGRPEDAMRDGVVDAVSGAGRSRRLAGVLSRRSAVLAAADGGIALPATACLCRMPTAKQAASGGVRNSGRPATPRNLSFTTTGNRLIPAAGRVDEKRPTVGVVWCKPATRTPPASTRGKGVR